MTALLKLIPWWAWAALAILAALAVQELRIRWVTADRDSLSAKYASTAAKAESLENTLRLQRELYADAEADEHKATAELTNALEANKRLASDVAAGKRRLLVQGKCVPGAGSSSGAAGLGEGEVELSPDAGRAYQAHRAELIKDQAKLAFLAERYESLREACRARGAVK